MNAQATFERIRSEIVGMTLSLLWRGHGSAIFLEFGELTPKGTRRDGSASRPTGEFSVGIEWSWRIENERSIVCGSWSEENIWEQSFALIRNTRLSALDTFSRLPELDLAFENQHHLLSFSTADGQPDWFIIDRRSQEPITLMVDDGQLVIEKKRER